MSEEPTPEESIAAEPISAEPISESEIEELLTTITTAAAGLQPNQIALLNAIVKMFREVEAAEIPIAPPVDRIPFASTFLPGRAKVVMDYANPESDSESPIAKFSQIAQYITRSPHP